LFLTFIRWYKKSNLKKSFELDENIAAEDYNGLTDNIFDAAEIMKVVNTLSAEKQEIIKLRFWGDMKFFEIAEKLNKNEAAVKKMFYRTIEEIKSIMS